MKVHIDAIRGANHGYPYRARCSECDWHSRAYAARHAAETMAVDHWASVHGEHDDDCPGCRVVS